MSLIVVASQPHSPSFFSPRFFRIRSLTAVIGEDSKGVLTSSSEARLIAKPLFAVYSFGQDGQASRFAVKPCLATEVLWLSAESTFEIDDYTFKFFPLSAEAEVLSMLELSDAQMDNVFDSLNFFLMVNYSVAGLSKSYPIFPDVELHFGGHQNNPIFINVPGALPNYGRILLEGDVIKILPEVTNSVHFNGETINASETFALPLEELPFRLQLKLNSNEKSTALDLDLNFSLLQNT